MPLHAQGHAAEIEMNIVSAQCSRPSISIQERLEVGNLTVDEVCLLKRRSRSGFYADIKAGLVEIRKQGRNTVVPGPIAAAYIRGEPIRVSVAA